MESTKGHTTEDLKGTKEEDLRKTKMTQMSEFESENIYISGGFAVRNPPFSPPA